jgi:hypothetical protein
MPTLGHPVNWQQFCHQRTVRELSIEMLMKYECLLGNKYSKQVTNNCDTEEKITIFQFYMN